jgi:hypothetical protein
MRTRKEGKESEEYVQQNKVHQNMERVEVRCGRQHRFERAVFGSTSLREMARRGEERRESGRQKNGGDDNRIIREDFLQIYELYEQAK